MSRVRARVHPSHSSQTDGELLWMVNHVQRDFMITRDAQNGFDKLLAFLTKAAHVDCALIAVPCTDQPASSFNFSLVAAQESPVSSPQIETIADLSAIAKHLATGSHKHIVRSESAPSFRMPFINVGVLEHLYIVPVTWDEQLLAVILLASKNELAHALNFFEPLFDCCATLLAASHSSPNEPTGTTSQIKEHTEKAEFENVERFVLDETVAQAQALVDAVPDAILVTSKSGLILDFHEPSDANIQVNPSRLIGRQHRDLFPEEFCDRWDTTVEQLFASGQTQTLLASLTIHGLTRDYESRVARIGDNRVVTVARDVTGRLTAERDLHESRSQLSLLLKELPAIQWSLDRELRFTSSVGRGLKEIGLEPGEAVGRLLKDFVAEAPSGQLILDKHMEVLDGNAVQYEAEFGGRIYLTSVEPILNSAGEVEGCLGVGLDITAGHESELARKKTETQLQTVFENVRDFILVIDEIGTIKFINRTSFGWAREDVIGVSIFDFNPEKYHDAIKIAMSKVFDHQEIAIYETVGRGRPDEWRTYTCHMAPMTVPGERDMAILVATDVTDNLATKAAKEKHYSLLKTVTNGLPDLIFSKDLEGRFSFVNQAMASFLGAHHTEIIGKSDQEFVSAEIAAISKKYDAQVYATSSSITYKQSMKKRSFLTSKIPWRDAQGEVIGLLGISRDITEQINDQETIEQQRSQLFHVSRLSTMGEMTAQISHEIKQPLAAIANYAGACLLTLEKEDADHKKVHEYLQLILQQAKRADDVMERIRSFAHSGKPIQVICDVKELITESINIIGWEMKQNQVTVTTQVLPKIFINADRTLMQQVIVNLLVNASDAMQNQLDDRRIEIVCSASETEIQVDVIDCGPGIPSDVINRIFETFFTTKTKTEGMGMGLAICKEIVESHRGRMEALNNSDKPGANFRFYIPRAKGIYESNPNHSSG